MTNTTKTTLQNASLAEHYYNMLSETYNERDGIPADAEDWERWLGLCLYYADFAI